MLLKVAVLGMERSANRCHISRGQGLFSGGRGREGSPALVGGGCRGLLAFWRP